MLSEHTSIPSASEAAFGALAVGWSAITGFTAHEGIMGLTALATIFSGISAVILRVVPAVRSRKKKAARAKKSAPNQPTNKLNS